MHYDDFFEQHLVLENDRVKLSALKKEDFDELDKIAFHPAIWKTGMSNLKVSKDLEEYIAAAINERDQHLSYPFLIYDKQFNKVAGSSRYGNISFAHKRLEIGWTWIHPEFHGTGLNKACKFLLLEYAFEWLEFNRVEIKTDVINEQSRKAILKIGAKEEGIFRKHQVTSEGRIRDSIYYSIIDDEWPSIKAGIFSI